MCGEQKRTHSSYTCTKENALQATLHLLPPQCLGLTVRFAFRYNAKLEAKHLGCTRPHYPELPGRRCTRILSDNHQSSAQTLRRTYFEQNNCRTASCLLHPGNHRLSRNKDRSHWAHQLALTLFTLFTLSHLRRSFGRMSVRTISRPFLCRGTARTSRIRIAREPWPPLYAPRTFRTRHPLRVPDLPGKFQPRGHGICFAIGNRLILRHQVGIRLPFLAVCKLGIWKSLSAPSRYPLVVAVKSALTFSSHKPRSHLGKPSRRAGLPFWNGSSSLRRIQ